MPFDDVELGPLLGKGGYGRVYRGLRNGEMLAVKVRRLSLSPKPRRMSAANEGHVPLCLVYSCKVCLT